MSFTPERTTAFQNAQIGIEATLGTPATTFTKLVGISVKPSPKIETNPFTPQGTIFPTIVAVGKDYSEAKFECSPIYEEMDFILGSLLCVGAAGTGVTNYFMSSVSVNTPQFYTLQTGESGACEQMNGAVVSGTTFKFNRDKIEISGDMFGQAMDFGATWTVGASSPASITPIAPKDVTVKVGGTALARCFSAELAISDRWKRVWIVDASEDSYVNVVEGIPSATVKLRCELDSEGKALIADLRSGNANQNIAIEAVTGDLSLKFDIYGAVSAIDELSDEDGAYAVTLAFNIVHDTAAGYAIKATLDTTSAS